MSVVIDAPRASALDRPGLDQDSTPVPQADELDPVIAADPAPARRRRLGDGRWSLMSANSAAFDHVEAFRWRQGDPSLADSEARLYDLGVLRSVLEEAVEIAVADARADGVTWARIGDALDVTHQAVIKRYRKGGGR